MRKLVVALPVIVVLAATAVGTALADGALTISVGTKATIVDRVDADVTVAVVCDALQIQTDGSVVVSLAQSSGSKTTSGSGSSAIVCDGAVHTYLVKIPASEGRWRNGSALVSASGSATAVVSIPTCGGDPPICTVGIGYVYDRGATGPTTITLDSN